MQKIVRKNKMLKTLIAILQPDCCLNTYFQIIIIRKI